jgi:hypothetical protein
MLRVPVELWAGYGTVTLEVVDECTTLNKEPVFGVVGVDEVRCKGLLILVLNCSKGIESFFDINGWQVDLAQHIASASKMQRSTQSYFRTTAICTKMKVCKINEEILQVQQKLGKK